MARRRFYRAARGWLLIAAGIAILCWSLTRYAQWPLVATLRHVAAFPACEVAEALGVAPAGQGQPGYWRDHDEDGNGIACEPLE